MLNNGDGYWQVFTKYGLNNNGGITLRDENSKNQSFEKTQYDSFERLIDRVKTQIKKN